MAAQHPDIAGSRDRVFGQVRDDVGERVGRTARCVEQEVDLAHGEAGEFNLEVEVDEILQFERQQVLVPAG